MIVGGDWRVMLKVCILKPSVECYPQLGKSKLTRSVEAAEAPRRTEAHRMGRDWQTELRAFSSPWHVKTTTHFGSMRLARPGCYWYSSQCYGVSASCVDRHARRVNLRQALLPLAPKLISNATLNPF